jgi:pSer/pThr/pTyr-binding forkhead associated (FHA) protein
MSKRHAHLHAIFGPDEGHEIALDAPAFVIGRSKECDLAIDHPCLSRQHAQIERQGQLYYLTDLKSTNGTFVNGERLGNEPHLLRDQDEIQLGQAVVVFIFVDELATKQAPTPGQTKPVGLRKGFGIEPASGTVWVRWRELDPPLTDLQFVLLDLLSSHEGEVVSREAIAGHVWPDQVGISDHMIDVLAWRLRKRLEEADPEHDYIHTVRGRGLMLIIPG